jgi:hypothetical protein
MSESENKSSRFDTLAWLAVITLVGFIAWFVFSSFVPVHVINQQPPCINNLHQLDGAKQEWALERGQTNGIVCREDDIKPYVKLDANGNLPKCPQGGIYTIGKFGEPVTCSLGTTVSPAHVLP